MKGWFCLCLSALALGPALAQEPPNLLAKPGFVGDANNDGLADGWEYSSGASRDKLDVTFGLEQLAPDRFAQRMTCTRYDGGHAMICQVGKVAVQEGHWYGLTMRYRGENLPTACVGLHDTDGWQQLGLWKSFSPRKNWRELTTRFQALRTCDKTTRFQIWFSSTGSLWVSDLSLTKIPAPSPSNVIPDIGHKNLLPNAGFEALGGWGLANYWTYGWEVAKGRGLGGSNCAAIAWRPDDPRYGYYFDYFDPVEQPQEKPVVQTIGFVPVKPGETYTLSVSMRAEKAGVPASIGFRGPGMWGEKKVTLATDWQRFSITSKASSDLAVVQIGPTFTQEQAAEFAGCVTYLDNAQLEVGAQPTEFSARPLEVFAQPFWQACGSPVPQTVEIAPEIVCGEPAQASLSLRVTDFADEDVLQRTQVLDLKPGANSVPLQLALPGPGFYRVKLSVKNGEQTAETSARGIVYLQPPNPADSPFGINHAYAYNDQLELAKRLGITWARDWSLKWEHVEPERGRFTFDRTDFQINRPLKLGMNVLCMFPFPSAEWSSTAPPELRKTGYPANRIRQAYAPRDPADLEKYVTACVERYRDRIRYWEVFNESIFTNYSLPKAAGYKPEDYVPLLQRAWAGCKRADPQCHVIGGYSAMPDMFPLYQAMFDQGGLQMCDELSVHWYPGDAPEGVAANLRRMNDMMAAKGAVKPTWMTEYAYYADDDPDPVKRNWPPLLDSEWQQAVWNTRACVAMLGHGVQKIFYHIWTTRLNYDIGATIFFEYAGAPHKIAATQAAMAYMLGEKPQCLKSAMELSEGVHGYLFVAPKHLRLPGRQESYVAVVWAEGEAGKMRGISGARVYDACGLPVGGGDAPLGEAPIYVVLAAGSTEAATRALSGSVAR